jgi:hypothetical protein
VEKRMKNSTEVIKIYTEIDGRIKQHLDTTGKIEQNEELVSAFHSTYQTDRVLARCLFLA